MVNSVNFFKLRIIVDGKSLDIGKDNIEGFERRLDMKSGLYTRSFTLVTPKGRVAFVIKRLLDMENCRRAYQRVKITSDYEADLKFSFINDFNVLHWGKDCYWKYEKHVETEDGGVIACSTLTTNQKVASCLAAESNCGIEPEKIFNDMALEIRYDVRLKKGVPAVFTRYCANVADKHNEYGVDQIISQAACEAAKAKRETFEKAVEAVKCYWQKFWENSDIKLEGDIENQQGIRYCIFQLAQTYHGFDKTNNIGAKGLTGEAYSGHAFWDTETYCLPYYLFNNTQAAKNLLLFRYNTLPQAKNRAAQLDCKGACYPIATLNGNEGCDLWQHASLQLQPSTGVAYGIWHYVNVTKDTEFLFKYGLEMLIEISRFLLSRGQWNSEHTKFGYYCVMGPDEFQMMVNHNCYTNFMAKKTFLYTLEVIDKYRGTKELEDIIEKTGFSDEEYQSFKHAADNMYLPRKGLLFEQHEGFFDLPHIDIRSIPVTDFPLYKNWSYDRIFRNDMIKQPDVLMFMLLYPQSFTKEEKRINYEYYEPRCIHESSLSPSVHSIIASEIGKKEEALNFFKFATRLDLDDYNRNTSEGLHMTSIAAAWLNIVYGFGGLRSDGDILSLSPTIIDNWKSYSFKLLYEGQKIEVLIDKSHVTLKKDGEKDIRIKVYDTVYTLKDALKVYLI